MNKNYYRGQAVYRTDIEPPCWTRFVCWTSEARTGALVETPDGGPDMSVSAEHLHDRAVNAAEFDDLRDDFEQMEWEQEEEEEQADRTGERDDTFPD